MPTSQAMTSYSRTRLHAPGANATANPNNQINTLNTSVEWNFKASGSYEMKYGILTSVNYEIRSGAPWQRTVLLSGGTTIPTQVVNADPYDVQYYDNLHLLDARVRKDFRIYGSHKAAIGVDIFNLLNANHVLLQTDAIGTTLGTPTRILAPRIVRFGATVRF